jgi:hypothetical protein
MDASLVTEPTEPVVSWFHSWWLWFSAVIVVLVGGGVTLYYTLWLNPTDVSRILSGSSAAEGAAASGLNRSRCMGGIWQVLEPSAGWSNSTILKLPVFQEETELTGLLSPDRSTVSLQTTRYPYEHLLALDNGACGTNDMGTALVSCSSLFTETSVVDDVSRFRSGYGVVYTDEATVGQCVNLKHSIVFDLEQPGPHTVLAPLAGRIVRKTKLHIGYRLFLLSHNKQVLVDLWYLQAPTVTVSDEVLAGDVLGTARGAMDVAVLVFTNEGLWEARSYFDDMLEDEVYEAWQLWRGTGQPFSYTKVQWTNAGYTCDEKTRYFLGEESASFDHWVKRQGGVAPF